MSYTALATLNCSEVRFPDENLQSNKAGRSSYNKVAGEPGSPNPNPQDPPETSNACLECSVSGFKVLADSPKVKALNLLVFAICV